MNHTLKNTPLHIGIIGYGHMGQKIEHEAKKCGHTICYTVDTNTNKHTNKHTSDVHYTNLLDIPENKISDTDIIIDFSLGTGVVKNAQWYSAHKIPALIGATGWNNDKKTVQDLASAHNVCILHGSNFSIGAHVFAKASQYIAQLIDKLPHYDIGIWENHHTHKKDRPSGTALTVAQGVLKKITRKTHIISDIPSGVPIDDKALAVVSQRIGYDCGFHELITNSTFDSIKLSHTAHTRTGFASGAVMAAQWLYTKKEIYSGKLISVDTWIEDLLV